MKGYKNEMHKLEKDDLQLLKELNDLSAEADWTVEELETSLRERGLDPNQLVAEVEARIKTFLDSGNLSNSVSQEADAEIIDSAATSPLGKLCETTGLTPLEIAQKQEVTVPFLINLEEHSNVVPLSWYRETAKRAAKLHPDVDEESVYEDYQNYQKSGQFAKAASRETAYSQRIITIDDLLKRSGIKSEDRPFWKSLAEKGEE